ncbi:MAG: hypothetical protein FJW23_05965 [Acidimicrobiia bacterium]|nr:hypothetical protein [Acidimicrobiia bacterium]
MTQVLRTLVVCAIAASAMACRQADGALPVPEPDRVGDIEDIARDMLNLQRGAPGAAQELEEDVMKLAFLLEDEAPARTLVRDLVDLLDGGVALSPEEAQQLAEQLWLGLTATEISERQAEAMADDVATLLSDAGFDQASATAMRARFSQVQAEVIQRQRRWYERF